MAKSKSKMRPLLKWPGGKYDEYKEFAKYIPSFCRYFEPFFGGGGVFFQLQPKGQSFVNDVNKDLITFYTMLSSKTLQRELYEHVNTWENIKPLSNSISSKVIPIFKEYARIGTTKAKEKIQEVLNTTFHTPYE